MKVFTFKLIPVKYAWWNYLNLAFEYDIVRGKELTEKVRRCWVAGEKIIVSLFIPSTGLTDRTFSISVKLNPSYDLHTITAVYSNK